MDEEKPSFWLNDDGELPFDVPTGGVSQKPKLFSLTSLFVLAALAGAILLAVAALYLQQSSVLVVPTLIPVTPAAEIATEYIGGRYGAQIRYDYSQSYTGSCDAQHVYGNVDGVESLIIKAQDGDIILMEQPIEAERHFDLSVPEAEASQFDVWLVDGSGERVMGIRNIALETSSAPTCAIEVTFYPATGAPQNEEGHR